MTNTKIDITYGKLDGSIARGDCPEGYITVGGIELGEWGPCSEDVGGGMSHVYRVRGYSATLRHESGVFFESEYFASKKHGGHAGAKRAMRAWVASRISNVLPASVAS